MSAVSKAVIGKAPSPYSQGCYFMGNTSPSLFKSHTGCICISLFLLCKPVLHSDSFRDSGFVIDITKSTRFRYDIHGKTNKQKTHKQAVILQNISEFPLKICADICFCFICMERRKLKKHY